MKVSIITINYNALEDTICFLESIDKSRRASKLQFEVVVVDNASRKCPKKALSDYSWVKVIKSKSNLGFAGGNNLGVKHSKGEYLLFVNNDAILDLADLETLIDQYKSNPEFGLLTPTILNEDESVQYAGYTKLNKLTGRNRLISQVKSNQQGISLTSFPHGAAMLISRDNLDRVGMMSENYFLYYEELDWGKRISDSGFKIGVSVKSKIIHKDSVSVGKISDCKLYFMTRNRILYARKHFSSIEQMVFMLFFFLVATPKNLITYLFKSDFNSVRVYFAAIQWHFHNDIASNKLGYKFDNLLS